MKPKLKLPGDKRLKVKCEIMLSISGFKFNVCRYTKSEAANSQYAHKEILARPVGFRV